MTERKNYSRSIAKPEIKTEIIIIGRRKRFINSLIYFAAKSGRMCAEAIGEGSERGKRMINEDDLRVYLEKWDKTYWPTYKALDVLHKMFYRSNPAREAFVEMCADKYVQKMTFDSYLYKRVVPENPLEDLKLVVSTIGSLVRANALRGEMDIITSL